MVALPTKQNLNSVAPQTPRPQGGVVSTNLNTKGQQVFAQGIQNLGEGLTRFAIAKDHSEYLQAKSALQAKSLQLETELSKDNDYSTYEERFTKGLQHFKETDPSFQKIKGGFFGNSYSQELQGDLSLVESRAYARLADIASKKETDASKAELLETLETNSQALLQTSDESTRSDILRTSSELIDSKVERNHIDKETAFRLKRGFAENYALNRFNLLTPQQQIQALNPNQKGKETYFEKTNSWSDAIPADKKPALLDRAKDQIRIDQERIKVDAERLARQQNNISKNNIINQINAGEDLSSINDQDWLKLGNKDKEMVRKLYMRKQGLGSSNPLDEDSAFYNYQDMYADNPKALAEIDPLQIEISVSPDKVAQVKQWQQDAFNNVKIPASVNKQRQVINTGLNEIGINPNSKKSTPYKKKFYEEIEAFEEINNKKASVDDLTKIKDKLIMKVVVDGWFSDDEKYMYQVKDTNKLIPSEQESDKISSEYYNQTGQYPTTEQVKQIYLQSFNE